MILTMARNTPGRPETPIAKSNVFGVWLRKARKAQGFTGEALAELADVSQGMISSYERGLKKPLPPTIERIAKALASPANPRASEQLLKDAFVAAGYQPPTNDSLNGYGDRVNERPYLYALRQTGSASAGQQRIVAVDAPTSDESPGEYRVVAIKVKGDCMEPHVLDGEVALILPPDALYDGCVVTATVDAVNLVCKRIRVTPSRSWLEPINGEGEIEEDRFIVTGVLANKVVSLLPPRP